MSRIIFVTGTDTGVGKTLLTAMLLSHLRDSGVNALAMKPFCSGDRGDVDLIQTFQEGELSYSAANPFYFAEAVAPWVAARKSGRMIQRESVLAAIREVSSKCELLLIEGAGGLLVPLGERFTIADLMKELACEAIVVSRNKLGTINHTCLTVDRLHVEGIEAVRVVLMQDEVEDSSSGTNFDVLRELLRGIEIFSFPFLGQNAKESGFLKANAKKLKKTLATILKADTFCVRSSKVLLKSETVKRLKAKKDR